MNNNIGSVFYWYFIVNAYPTEARQSFCSQPISSPNPAGHSQSVCRMAAVSPKPAPSVLGPSRKRLIQCTGTNPWDALYEALVAIRASLVRWYICNIWALPPGAVPPIVGGPAHTLRLFNILTYP